MREDFKKLMKAAGIRAVRTIAQAAVAAIGASTVLGDVDWRYVASSAALAGFLSILMSISTGLPEVTE